MSFKAHTHLLLILYIDKCPPSTNRPPPPSNELPKNGRDEEKERYEEAEVGNVTVGPLVLVILLFIQLVRTAPPPGYQPPPHKLQTPKLCSSCTSCLTDSVPHLFTFYHQSSFIRWTLPRRLAHEERRDRQCHLHRRPREERNGRPKRHPPPRARRCSLSPSRTLTRLRSAQ